MNVCPQCGGGGDNEVYGCSCIDDEPDDPCCKQGYAGPYCPHGHHWLVSSHTCEKCEMEEKLQNPKSLQDLMWSVYCAERNEAARTINLTPETAKAIIGEYEEMMKMEDVYKAGIAKAEADIKTAEARHDMAKAFHDLAVSERNLYRHRLEKLGGNTRTLPF